MKFLNPTIDLMFRKLFGNPATKEVTISFLNSVLGRTGKETIVDVTITDPANLPDAKYLKYSVVDVRCTDQNKHEYIVEMQVDDEHNYAQRSQQYAALALARQLEVGAKYEKAVPVIFIGVLDFTLFPNSPDYLSKHCTLNVKTHKQELNLIEYHYIELPKFKKPVESLVADVDKWAYLLKNAHSLNEIPKQLCNPHALEVAMGALERGAMSKSELEMYDRAEMGRRIEENVLYAAELKGKAEGEAKAKLVIAKQMLDEGMSVAIVAKVTGLPVNEIEKLKQ